METYTLASKYIKPVGTVVETVPTTPCVLHIVAGRFLDVNEVITSEYKLVIYVGPTTNIERIRKECKCEVTFVIAKDYLLDYRSMEMQIRPTYSVTPLAINDTLIYVVGEEHTGVPSIMNWKKCKHKVLVLFEAGNMLYNVKPWSKFWLRDSYFSYWYKDYTDCIDFNITNTEPNPNVTFIPCDIRESVGMNPIMKPYFLIPWCCSTLKRGNIERDRKFFKQLKLPHHPTIEDIKASGFYNKDKSDEYYTTLIEKYSFDTLNDMKQKVTDVIFKETMIEFFKDATFDIAIDASVEKWFSRSCNDFMRYYGCINDIFTLNQLLSNYKDYPYVIIYGGGNHSLTFVKFILDVFDRPYKDNVNEIFDHLKQL